MTITLAEINKVVLRQSFLPWFRREMAAMGVTLPSTWNPDDAELAKLAALTEQALREAAEDPDE